jgi:hypothetical protein
MVSKQKTGVKSKPKSKTSKNKHPSTDELLKMYDDNSFLKNFKNKQLSALIKDKSENDIQKNAMKIGSLIYKLIIRKLPLIIYTLMKLDGDLREWSLLRNPVLKAIYMNKGTKLQKINQLYNYLVFEIQDKPRILFTFIKIMDIKDIFDERKINIRLTDPKVAIYIVIFFLNLQNKDKETIDDIIAQLSRTKQSERSEQCQNKINLLKVIKDCLTDDQMCDYRKLDKTSVPEQNNTTGFSFRNFLPSPSSSGDVAAGQGDDYGNDNQVEPDLYKSEDSMGPSESN